MGTLQDQIRTIAARYQAQHPDKEVKAFFAGGILAADRAAPGTDETVTAYYCEVCRSRQVDQAGDLCPQCVKDKARGYSVRTLAGRCHDGAERDHGTRRHALPVRGSYWGDDMGRALCGAKPGRRSVGWTDWGAEKAVTCPRCLNVLWKGGVK